MLMLCDGVAPVEPELPMANEAPAIDVIAHPIVTRAAKVACI
jgi:hypothetical protein